MLWMLSIYGLIDRVASAWLSVIFVLIYYSVLVLKYLCFSFRFYNFSFYVGLHSFSYQLDIRSVEQGICPIAALYLLRFTLVGYDFCTVNVCLLSSTATAQLKCQIWVT